MNIIPYLFKPGYSPTSYNPLKEAGDVSTVSDAQFIKLECEKIRVAYNSEHKYMKLPNQQAVVIDINKKFHTVQLMNVILGNINEFHTQRRLKTFEYAFVEWNLLGNLTLAFYNEDGRSFVDYFRIYKEASGSFVDLTCRIRSGEYYIMRNAVIIIPRLVLEEAS